MFTIIYVDFYSIEKTLAACENIIQNTAHDYIDNLHFVIVDNSVTGYAVNYIKSNFVICEDGRFEDKKYIKFKYDVIFITVILAYENLGYARGNNLGILYSKTKYNDEYIVVSNNDVTTNKIIEWSKIRAFFLNHPNTLSIGPNIIDKKSNKGINPKKRISFFNQMILYYYNVISRGIIGRNFTTVEKTDNKKITNCYTLTGSFVVFSRINFEKIGLYDPNTFLFYEENIIGEKSIMHNYHNYYIPTWRFVHEHGYTIKKTNALIKSSISSFKSGCYYYGKYRNVNYIFILIAKINFYIIYLPVLKLKERFFN